MHRQNSPHPTQPPDAPSPAHRATRRPAKAILAAGFLGLLLVILAASHSPAVRSAWSGLTSKPQSLSEPSHAQPVISSSRAAVPGSATPTPVSASPEIILSTEELAQKLWAEFEKSSWGATPETWSTQHPEISCAAFHGRMWNPAADAQWSERCSSSEQAEAARWSFYAFDLQPPLVSRLEQFDVSSPFLSPESFAAVRKLLQARLEARFGPAQDLSSKFAPARAAAWPPNLLWKSPDLEIQLFQSESDPQRNAGRLRLQARHRALLEALQQDARLKPMDMAANYAYQAGTPLDAQLAEKLRLDFPGAADMLLKQRPAPDPQKVAQALQQWQQQFRASQAAGQTGARAAVIAVPQDEWQPQAFVDALLRLLAAAKSAPPDRQPLLLLAADRLAGRLPFVVGNDHSQVQHWPEWRSQLAQFGLPYEEPVPGQSPNAWAYRGTLLQRVSADYPQTEWGERAFLQLLDEGFETGEDCAAGSDQFRPVIAKGLQFLEQHPNSPYRLDVQLAIAQAYETWWSLSQAPAHEEDTHAEAAKYQEGAAAAREKAIALYESFLQSAPQSDTAAYALRQLPRLKLGLDTGQRRYYCEVGD